MFVYACVFSEVFRVVTEDKYLVGCDTMQSGGCNLWHSEHCAASVISINELLCWLIWPVLLKCQYISARLHGVTSQGCFLYLYFVIYHCCNVVRCVWNAGNFAYCLQMAGHPDCLLHSDYLVCSSHKSISHIFWAFPLVWFCLEPHIVVRAKHVLFSCFCSCSVMCK